MLVGSDEAKIFAGPLSLSERENWRRQLHAWKLNSAKKIKYDDSLYSKSKFKSYDSFNVALIWLWDELLFNYETQKFTPEKLIKEYKKFGGLDGIILWHAYPVIGIDSRNQFDFYNQVEGLEELISEFQNTDIKVFLNYNPWDRWTNRPEREDQQELATLVKRFKFDGVFLDTMKSADPDFMAPILAVNPNIIVAGESRVQQERICDHAMSWAQWFADSEIPGVIRAKWFEPRHMLHQTRRWNRSHIQELHIAWLNGTGMLLWEVVFGSWVGWNRREMTMWKEMVKVLRTYKTLICEGSWEPLTKLSDEAEKHGLYASKFSFHGTTLLTVINKSAQSYCGEIIDGLIGTLPEYGVSAVVIDQNESRLLNFSYQDQDGNFPDTKPQRVKKLAGQSAKLDITYRNRECGLYDGAPFIDAWKPLPPDFHQFFTLSKDIQIRKGSLDSQEITNREFFEFMLTTNYRPATPNRFLNHWVNNSPLDEDLDQAVTYVDLGDASAYAQWVGCSIPTEWEWQAYFKKGQHSNNKVWNLTDSIHSDGRTRFLVLKGGSIYNIRNGQGSKSATGIAESDWYVDGGIKDSTWVEKFLLMGLGMNRSENIGFRCFHFETYS